MITKFLQPASQTYISFLSWQLLHADHLYFLWRLEHSLKTKVKAKLNAFFSIKKENVENISNLRGLSGCQSLKNVCGYSHFDKLQTTDGCINRAEERLFPSEHINTKNPDSQGQRNSIPLQSSISLTEKSLQVNLNTWTNCYRPSEIIRSKCSSRKRE